MASSSAYVPLRTRPHQSSVYGQNPSVEEHSSPFGKANKHHECQIAGTQPWHQLTKQPPLAVSRSCTPFPLTATLPRCSQSLRVPCTGTSQVTARWFLAARHGGHLLCKKHKENQGLGALSSIANNVQRCVRCRHLTPTSNSCVGPVTADARSQLLGHCQGLQMNESCNANFL